MDTTTLPRQETTTDDTDELAHLFCGRCWKKARAHAQPRRALCGREKYVWVKSPHGERPICVVCTSLRDEQQPCPRCGVLPL